MIFDNELDILDFCELSLREMERIGIKLKS